MGNCVLRVIHIVDKFMEVFSALILGGMTLFIFAQVLARYVFKSPLAWSEEGARFMFIWMTFIAGYVGARKGQHIGVELIQNLFPESIKAGMKVLCDLISIGFLSWYCFTAVPNGINLVPRHRPRSRFQWLLSIWE